MLAHQPCIYEESHIVRVLKEHATIRLEGDTIEPLNQVIQQATAVPAKKRIPQAGDHRICSPNPGNARSERSIDNRLYCVRKHRVRAQFAKDADQSCQGTQVTQQIHAIPLQKIRTELDSLFSKSLHYLRIVFRRESDNLVSSSYDGSKKLQSKMDQRFRKSCHHYDSCHSNTLSAIK